MIGRFDKLPSEKPGQKHDSLVKFITHFSLIGIISDSWCMSPE